MANQAFVWKSGRGFNVPADIVNDQIQRITAKEGDCSAHALVDAARPESSPIHGLFEWNDEIAGEKWRVSQARVVICSIRTVDEQSTPAYVSARVMAPADELVDADGNETEDSGYRSISVIQSIPEDRRSWLLHELRTIAGHLRRVQDEPEFAPLIDALPLVEAALVADDAVVLAA